MDIVIIGEVLWDQFENERLIGGAPYNVAANLRRFGHDVALITGVGNDNLGNEALAQIAAHNLSTDYVTRTDDAPTGIVSVTLKDGQPDYIIHRPAAYDIIKLSDEEKNKIQKDNPGWIYFGTLAQSSSMARKTTGKIISSNPQAKIFYDVNLRKDNRDPELIQELLSESDIVKLNEDELGEIGRFLNIPAGSIEDQCRNLANQFQLEGILVTRDKKGCAAFIANPEEYLMIPGEKIVLKDAVGAGDGFCSAFLHARMTCQDWKDSISLGNRLGALIATRKSALPEWKIDEIA